ncbi:hypothetical protein GQ53DRAFT_418100 [Thozetella sp. PMI_491]|nr:hypothetical protein GQ53DRAFT_418100 [Thozetella sp. PMI_491]
MMATLMRLSSAPAFGSRAISLKRRTMSSSLSLSCLKHSGNTYAKSGSGFRLGHVELVILVILEDWKLPLGCWVDIQLIKKVEFLLGWIFFSLLEFCCFQL